LASTLTLAEQEERRRIAQILHDDLQQLLYAIRMRITNVGVDLAGADALVKQQIQEVDSWLTDAIRITRRLTVELSPPMLKEEGLVDALGWLATQMAEDNDLRVAILAEHPIRIASQDIRVLLFQIVRELLFNVVKHTLVDQATVELHEDDASQLLIIVADKGRGFDVGAASAAHAGGFGLFSVRERLAFFGGQMTIVSAPGAGTQVTVSIALDAQVAGHSSTD
jgi:signal transduction histidine kinase